jgi:hypothetical protein
MNAFQNFRWLPTLAFSFLASLNYCQQILFSTDVIETNQLRTTQLWFIKKIFFQLKRFSLQTNDALVASLLRLKDNSCHVEESERVLMKYKKYKELVVLYQTKGLHKKGRLPYSLFFLKFLWTSTFVMFYFTTCKHLRLNSASTCILDKILWYYNICNTARLSTNKLISDVKGDIRG